MGYASEAKKISDVQLDYNKQIAELIAEYNRYNTTTPFGNINWNKDPTTGKYSQETTLSPLQQGLYQQNVTYDQTASGLAQRLLEESYGKLAKPMNYGDLGFKAPGSGDFSADRQRYEDAAYRRLTKDKDKEYGRSRSNLEQKLLNEGVPRGSMKYQAAMADFDRSRNADFADIRDRAVSLGSGEQSRMFGLAANARDRAVRERSDASSDPLRKISALLAGSAFMGAPNTVSAPINVEAPNYTGIASSLAGIEAQKAMQAQALAQDQNQFNSTLGLTQAQFNASQPPSPWTQALITAGSSALGSLAEEAIGSSFKKGSAVRNYSF